MPSPPNRHAAVGALLAAALLGGCSPVLDWREVRLADSRAQVLMPCKPSAQERNVSLAGQPVRLSLHACAAGGQTWGIAFADVAEPGRVGPAMAELGASAAGNIGAGRPGRAAAARPIALQVPGATPHAASQRWRLQGTRPDGTPLHMQLAVFAHGTRVFQATALGEPLADDAADTFFGGLRIRP
ncbi:MAG: hypothetical protein LH480_04670 [Rubrivivax sp.]|nr:hypothetical protein [Rubrivivax sp.]